MPTFRTYARDLTYVCGCVYLYDDTEHGWVPLALCLVHERMVGRPPKPICDREPAICPSETKNSEES